MKKNRTSNLIHWFVFLTSVRGIMLYTNRASGEVAGILDQLNPLVPKAKCM